MKVMVLQQGAPGGIGRVEQLLHRALQRDAAPAASVRTISRRKPHAQFVEAAELPLAGTIVHSNALTYTLRSLFELITTRPDVIVYTHLNLAQIHLAVSWLKPRAQAILFVHGREVWEDLSWPKRFALRRCSQIITLTQYVAGTVDEAMSSRHAPIAVVPGCLSDAWIAGVEPRQEPTGQAVVLTVSRLEQEEGRKGVDRVIEAMPSVMKRVPGAILRIVGDGSDRRRLEQLAAASGVEECVEFLGAVDDATLKRLYATSDVFALPSVQEGFGLVYLEAMSHGLPSVIATDTAVVEVVEPEVSGVDVHPDRVDELAEAICSLLTDRARWSQMSRMAADRFQERYREVVFGQRLRHVLEAS
jgi:glycosyltransferase involved in cell wall biosynthesis